MQAPQLIGPVENRPELFQIVAIVNVLIQQLQFVQRLEAVGAHDAIVHYDRSLRNHGVYVGALTCCGPRPVTEANRYHENHATPQPE